MPTQEPLPAAIRVFTTAPDPAATPPVNRLLFGKFTEHLGRNVYGGAWAQIARNPAFAPPSVWPDAAELQRRLQQAAADFQLGTLTAGDAPPWWTAQGTTHSELGEEHGQPLWTVDAGPGAALTTPVYLPVHRIARYRLHLEFRGDVPLEISLRRPGAPRDTWATAHVDGAHSKGWFSRVIALAGQGGPTAPAAPATPAASTVPGAPTVPAPIPPAPTGTPFHLVITPLAPGRLQLRRCLLFPADALDRWDPDIVRFMRDARLPLLRFPGGNFVSGYHWRDGVGPLDGRPVLPNPAWPEVEWNHVGTDEWLRLCELVGCAPMICVNAGNGTPEEAAQWVEYCNGPETTPMGALRARHGHPQPYGVHYWEVGNELYGHWQIGHAEAAAYAARYRIYAEAMVARDPSILLIANGHDEDWNRAVVAANPDRTRSLSHHCLYPGFPADADPERVYLEHMAFTPAYAEMWQDLTRPMREAGVQPRLAITEQQVFTHNPKLPTNATLTEALWTASIINEAIRAGDLVDMLTHSALVNHGGGLRKEREIAYAQPVWWTTHLYATTPEPLYPLDLEVDTPRFTVIPYRLPTVPDAPFLDAVAMADASRQVLFFFLVNRHPDRALALTLSLPPGAAFRDAEIHTLTGDSYMARNTLERPTAVAPVVEHRPWAGALLLPPCSLVRLRLS